MEKSISFSSFYIRCNNLRDILVRAKHRRPPPKTCTPGAFRCNRSRGKTCPFITEGTTSYVRSYSTSLKSRSQFPKIPHTRPNVPVPVLYTAVYFVTLPRHLTEQYTILSGKPEMSMDSPTSMRNNSYLLTLQANFATICWMRKHTTPTLPDFFLFLLESQAKVLTNQGTPFRSKQKKRTRCIKVGLKA